MPKTRSTRCARGTRKNRKTKECEPYSSSKSSPSKKTKSTKSKTKSAYLPESVVKEILMENNIPAKNPNGKANPEYNKIMKKLMKLKVTPDSFNDYFEYDNNTHYETNLYWYAVSKVELYKKNGDPI